MLNQKKIEIFLTKIRKSLAKQFLEIAFIEIVLHSLFYKYKNRKPDIALIMQTSSSIKF